MTPPTTHPTPNALLLPGAGTKGAYPDLPQGWGAVEVTFDFTAELVVESAGVPIEERPHWDHWVDPPTLAIDGKQRQAGWSSWAYPLPAGPHTLRFRTPSFAERTIEISAGEATRIKYHATIVSRMDQANATPGGEVLQTTATAQVRALKARPTG